MISRALSCLLARSFETLNVCLQNHSSTTMHGCQISWVFPSVTARWSAIPHVLYVDIRHVLGNYKLDSTMMFLFPSTTGSSSFVLVWSHRFYVRMSVCSRYAHLEGNLPSVLARTCGTFHLCDLLRSGLWRQVFYAVTADSYYRDVMIIAFKMNILIYSHAKQHILSEICLNLVYMYRRKRQLKIVFCQ